MKIELQVNDLRDLAQEVGSCMYIIKKPFGIMWFVVMNGTMYYTQVDSRDLLNKPFPTEQEIFDLAKTYIGVKTIQALGVQ